MFITFEGLDFSGKSTQSRLLFEFLKKKGKKVKLLREPGGTVISEKIREILLDKEHDEMHPLTEFLLFSASRAQLVKQVIEPGVKDNIIIICDRYFDSSTAYQGVAGELDIRSVKYVNKFATENLFPDLTFFIDIPPELSWKRAKLSTTGLDRIEGKKKKYYEKVCEGFRKIAEEKRKGFRTIDGTRSIEEISREIINITKKYLNKRNY